MSMGRNICGLYLVPGMPHLKTNFAPYKELQQAMSRVQEDIARTGAQRILYYSTQWLSVLGVSFQARAELSGRHVDENWHELCDALPFAMKVDCARAEKMALVANEQGFSTALIDFEGFPVDTGTIVADDVLNPDKLPVNMVSSHVYADHQATGKLAQTLAQVLSAADELPTAVVGVSMLSGNYFTEEIDLREDHIRNDESIEWDRKMMNAWQGAEYDQADALLADYAGATKADMGLKAYSFLRGFMQVRGEQPAEVLAYGAINGGGAAVVKF